MKTSTHYKVTGTRSFRLSATKILDRWGSNLQNNNETLSRCLVAPPGHKLVSVDQSGAEALVVAYLAKPGRFRELFANGIKPHTYMALQIFLDELVPQEERDQYRYVWPADLIKLPDWPALAKRIKNDTTKYATGKRVIHADNYGMRWPTYIAYVLAESEGSINLSKQEASYQLQTKAETFPEISEWQVRYLDEVKSTRIVRNLFGHPRRITTPWSDSLARELLSFVPQSTVGCITHYAATALQHEIESKGYPWDILNNKHDSYVIQAPDNDVALAVPTMRRHMEQELTAPDGTVFRMKSEALVGQNLGHYDPIENPDGLKEYEL